MRILLADAQSRVRFALRVLLERQPDMEVAGDIAHGEELLTSTRETCPDLVLLDWGLPGLTDELLDTLRQECPGVYVIALSGRPEAGGQAIDSGADAFVCKCDSAHGSQSNTPNCTCIVALCRTIDANTARPQPA